MAISITEIISDFTLGTIITIITIQTLWRAGIACEIGCQVVPCITIQTTKSRFTLLASNTIINTLPTRNTLPTSQIPVHWANSTVVLTYSTSTTTSITRWTFIEGDKKAYVTELAGGGGFAHFAVIDAGLAYSLLIRTEPRHTTQTNILILAFVALVTTCITAATLCDIIVNCTFCTGVDVCTTQTILRAGQTFLGELGHIALGAWLALMMGALGTEILIAGFIQNTDTCWLV